MKLYQPKNKISIIIIAFFALLVMIPEEATAQRFGHFTPHAVMPRPMPMPRPTPRPIPPTPRPIPPAPRPIPPRPLPPPPHPYPYPRPLPPPFHPYPVPYPYIYIIRLCLIIGGQHGIL